MKEEIAQLNALLRLCRNAEKGYKTASQQVEDSLIENTLNNYSQQRNEFAYELEQQIRIQGGEPLTSGDLTASAHRIWINIKGLLSGEDTTGIIQECLRGERESINFYEKIMNETTFPNDVRMLLAHHVKEIRAAREKLEELIS